MDAAFLSPAAPPVCLGLRLKPLTVGHLALLAEIESPFAHAGLWELSDLFAAVFLCAEAHHRSRRHLSAWWRGLFFAVWTRLAYRSAGFQHGAFQADAERFAAYLSAGQTCPELRARDPDSRPLGSPRHLQLLARLMHDFSFSRDAALSLTVAEANALIVTLAELSGRVELIGPRMTWLRAFAREQDAARNAGFQHGGN